MQVKCPTCGTENWLENQSRCFQCDAVLRRCVDCTVYDRSQQLCRALNTDIDGYEAEHPSLLSISTNCTRYQHDLRSSS